MAKALVVVESPAKAKTINKYLGREYKVLASMGHVRDLPKSKLGVDVDEGFAPVYEPIAARKKVIAELKSAAKDATDIYIATDPDREGEAIGWHLAEELGTKKKKIHRLMFNEITKKAVQEALNHPGQIDMKMVDAQQARRVLDRLVGYKISPILWDKVRRGLERRPRPVRGAEADLRSRAGDREVRAGGVLAPVRVARRSGAAGVRGQARQAPRREHQDHRTSSSRKTYCAISKARRVSSPRWPPKSASATPRRRSLPASCSRPRATR